MTEIHCKNCNHTLAKGIEIGSGFFYLTGNRDMVLYRQVIQCRSCGSLNEIKVKVGVSLEIKILSGIIKINETDEFNDLSKIGIEFKKNNLYSA